MESVQSSTASDKSSPVGFDGREGRSRRPVSAFEPRTQSSIAIQTDHSESTMRMVRSYGDVGHPIKPTASLEQLDEKTTGNLLSDVVSLPPRPLSKSKSAITFDQLEKNVDPNDLSAIQVFIANIGEN